MSARREARKGGTALRPYPGDALLALLSALLLVLSFAHSVDAGPGDLDATFGTGGRVLTDFGGGAGARALALQADGRIVVAGLSRVGVGDDFALARYNPNGSLDSSFGSGGRVLTDFGLDDEARAVVLQADGKIVVAGGSGGAFFALARYNADGTLDPSFGSEGRVCTNVGGRDGARALALQSDGKIVVAGFSDVVGFGFALARYNPDGSLDPSFGSGGRVLTGGVALARGLALQSDGKIVVAGFSDAGGGQDFALARYNPDGTLDLTFGTGGKVTTDFGGFDDAFALALPTDGKIVVAGSDGSDFALARYETRGVHVTAPAVLGLAPDLTPGAPTGSVVWAPNPFQVDAFFTNPGPNTASGNLTLDLSSAGSQLSSLSPTSVPFSNVGPGETVHAQWQVRANAPGEAHYRVRVTNTSFLAEQEVVTRVPELVVPPVDNPRNQGPFPLVADGRFCIESEEGRNDCVADFEGNVGGVPSVPFFEWQGITPTGFKAGPTGAIPVL